MSESERESREWHLNQGVPLSIVAFLIVQTLALGYWGASMVSMIEANRTANETLREDHNKYVTEMTAYSRRQWDRITELDKKDGAVETRLASLKTSQDHIIKQLDRILTLIAVGRQPRMGNPSAPTRDSPER